MSALEDWANYVSDEAMQAVKEEVDQMLADQRNQMLDDIKADFLAGIDNDTPEDMVVAIKACCVDLWKYRVAK